MKVRLDGREQMVTSSITKEAALELELAAGQTATVFVKSTYVMISTE